MTIRLQRHSELLQLFLPFLFSFFFPVSFFGCSIFSPFVFSSNNKCSIPRAACNGRDLQEKETKGVVAFRRNGCSPLCHWPVGNPPAADGVGEVVREHGLCFAVLYS